MVQQTRKDPRAKVLSMTVRYKSATLDEFIEHHSHDVSRGGMFIKTPQPFPPGTLLKFEVRIAEDRKVMQGVGRVVWKRDNAASDLERPSGMGVKFIKLDDESRRLIEQLLTNRQEDDSAFDAEKAADVDAEAPVGLGLSQISSADSSGAERANSFFPKTDNAPMPAPEDRTVMKQASELLEEALREVGSGSSVANVPTASNLLAEATEGTDEDTKPGRPSRNADPLGNLTKDKSHESGKPTDPQLKAKQVSEAVSASQFVAAAKAVSIPSVARPSLSAKPSASAPLSTKPSSPKPLLNERKSTASTPSTPRASKPAVALPEPQKPASGQGRGVFWLLAVAASVGIVYWVTRERPVPAPTAEPVATETQPVAAPTTESATTPAPAAIADGAVSDAAAPSASVPPSTTVPPVESAAPPVVTAALPVVTAAPPVVTAAPPVVKVVNVKPKAAKPVVTETAAQPDTQASPAAPESGTATAPPPVVEKPVAEVPAAKVETAPAPATPTPTPTPKPKAEKSDNPY